MRHHPALRTLLLLALLALTGLGLGAAPTASAGTGSASPQQAPPGARVHFSAAGFTPGERVGLVADKGGAVAWNWTAPGDARAGTWQMVVRDRTTRAEYKIAFTVAAAGAAPAASSSQGDSIDNDASDALRFTIE